LIRDGKILIRGKHPGSATLLSKEIFEKSLIIIPLLYEYVVSCLGDDLDR
jgi:hypothetical protein